MDECRVKLEHLTLDSQGSEDLNTPAEGAACPLKCQCGKLWNQHCATLALFSEKASVYAVDSDRFEACKTPEERRALVSDPTALIRMSEIHGISKINSLKATMIIK